MRTRSNPIVSAAQFGLAHAALAGKETLRHMGKAVATELLLRTPKAARRRLARKRAANPTLTLSDLQEEYANGTLFDGLDDAIDEADDLQDEGYDAQVAAIVSDESQRLLGYAVLIEGERELVENPRRRAFRRRSRKGGSTVEIRTNPGVSFYSRQEFNAMVARGDVKRVASFNAALPGEAAEYAAQHGLEAAILDSSGGQKMNGWFFRWTTKNQRKRRNPEGEAAELYETFHGRESEQFIEYHVDEHEHENYAALGDLVELKVILVSTGKEATLTAPDPEGGDLTQVIKLCSSEDGGQLYFIGGDQSIDLAALGFKSDEIKDCTVVGILHECTYRTEKGFDKFQLIDYYHALGEETGQKPVLLYDPHSQLMRVAGGAYKVKNVGIVN